MPAVGAPGSARANGYVQQALGRVQDVLARAPAAADALGSQAYRKLVEDHPSLEDPTQLVVEHSVDMADAALATILDGMVSFAEERGIVDTAPFQDFLGAVNEYWEVDEASGLLVKRQGGGVDKLRRLIRTHPLVQEAARSAVSRMLPLRLYSELGDTQKVLVWLGALGAYGAAHAVQRKDEDVYQLSVPGVGSFTLDGGKVRDLSFSVSRTLARVGTRQRKLRGYLSTKALSSKGSDSLRAGVVVPVHRKATLELEAGAQRAVDQEGKWKTTTDERGRTRTRWEAAPGTEATAKVTVARPSTESHPVRLEAGVAQTFAVTRSGKRVQVEPSGRPDVSLAMSGPLPSLNPRLRQLQAQKRRTARLRDRTARRMAKAGVVDAGGKPYTYRQLSRKSVERLHEIEAQQARREQLAKAALARRATGPGGRPYTERELVALPLEALQQAAGEGKIGSLKRIRVPELARREEGPGADVSKRICYRYIDFLRLYRPGEWNPNLCIVYANASPVLADECQRQLDALIEEEAQRRRVRPKSLQEEFEAQVEERGMSSATLRCESAEVALARSRSESAVGSSALRRATSSTAGVLEFVGSVLHGRHR